jgi:hypothetical protein
VPSNILRARMLAIACGNEYADDLDHLRSDPGFKLACGRLPDTEDDLCSQPTMSRWENAPSLREVIRMTYAMIDAYCTSYPRQPIAVTLDIDDTVDVVHGHQQLPLFNAHYDERCFLPIHVYETAISRPVAILLRPGKTPSGDEALCVREVVARIGSKPLGRGHQEVARSRGSCPSGHGDHASKWHFHERCAEHSERGNDMQVFARSGPCIAPPITVMCKANGEGRSIPE